MTLAYTLVSLVLDLAQMALAVLKQLQMTNIIKLDNFDFKIFSKKNSLGMSSLRSSRNLLAAPAMIRMGLAVGKHLRMTKVIILDNFDFKKFFKKTFPGHVLAQVFQKPIGASNADQVRKTGKVFIRCSS